MDVSTSDRLGYVILDDGRCKPVLISGGDQYPLTMPHVLQIPDMDGPASTRLSVTFVTSARLEKTYECVLRGGFVFMCMRRGSDPMYVFPLDGCIMEVDHDTIGLVYPKIAQVLLGFDRTHVLAEWTAAMLSRGASLHTAMSALKPDQDRDGGEESVELGFDVDKMKEIAKINEMEIQQEIMKEKVDMKRLEEQAKLEQQLDPVKTQSELYNESLEKLEDQDHDEGSLSMISEVSYLNKLNKLDAPNTADILRFLLITIEFNLTSPPDEDIVFKVPHLNGDWCEHMIISLFRKYSFGKGYLNVNDMVRFIEDSGIAETHVPYNKITNRPNQGILEELDPNVLFRNAWESTRSMVREDQKNNQSNKAYGISSRNDDEDDDDEDDIDDMDDMEKIKHIEGLKFLEFYQMLFNISGILYPEIIKTNPTLAFERFLREVIIPLYLFHKVDKTQVDDNLVVDNRSLLFLFTYLSNFWQLFVNYSQDILGAAPPLTISFPQTAQETEWKQVDLFSLPFPRLPLPLLSAGANLPFYFITKSGFYKLARDYGLIPYFISKNVIEALFNEIGSDRHNIEEEKLISINASLIAPTSSSSIANKNNSSLLNQMGIISQLPTSASIASRYDHKKRIEKIMKEKKERELQPEPFRFHTVVNENSPMKKNKDHISKSKQKSGKNRAMNAKISLGFCEFVELLAKIGIIGYSKPPYDEIYPTVYEKVTAFISLWGIGDTRVLNEVNILQS